MLLSLRTETIQSTNRGLEHIASMTGLDWENRPMFQDYSFFITVKMDKDMMQTDIFKLNQVYRTGF